MVDRLSLYLHEATALAFDPAGRNCGLWVADWVRFNTGRDPAAAFRGLAEVDILAAATAGLAAFPIARTPLRGDVGVVLAPQPTAAICLGGDRWAALAPRGLAGARWRVLRAWSIPLAPEGEARA